MDSPFDTKSHPNKTMSLRIVYSHDFSIQPRYREKTGITQDEHDRNVRRLKMFDCAPPITPLAEVDGTGREQSNESDNSPHNTQRANEDTGNEASAASRSLAIVLRVVRARSCTASVQC